MCNCCYYNPISIHAPLRGATAIVQQLNEMVPISIHAPLRGATVGNIATEIAEIISIHAPLRGATISNNNITIFIWYFNPRSPAGSDLFKERTI